jgi:hypothetical protein
MGGAVTVHPEHAVRQHAEIARPGAGHQASLLVAILDIEPDRPAVVMIHARIHGKDQLAAIGRDGVSASR